MAKTVIGLFETASAAQRAVQDLLEHGFGRADISVVAARTGESDGAEPIEYDVDGKHAGLAAGASAGALLGGVAGLLVGLGVLAIPGVGPVLAAGPLAATLAGVGIGAATGSLIGALADIGVPEDEARLYEEGLRLGGTLVAVRTSEDLVTDAVEALSKHGAVDVIRRAGPESERGGAAVLDGNAEETQKEGRNMADIKDKDLDSTLVGKQTAVTGAKGGMAATQTTANTRPAEGNAMSLQVIEEELAVGKREVERGGVRVFTHVTEREVNEQVQLRDEKVTVERRPVDRPVSPDAVGTFQEGTIEVRARGEEAVVAKQARVVEEVVISKDVRQHTETIHDTLRRKDVDVQNLPASGAHGAAHLTGVRGFDDYGDDFRRHYSTSYAKTGMSYDQYTPAYRYGYELANEPRYSGKPWTTVESDAQRAWESKNPGSWERFKDAVRHAWDGVTGKTSA